MKLATWNVNSLRVRLPHVLAWLQVVRPEILVLQEIKTVNADFAVEALRAAGYHIIFSGEKSYNGVAILSRTLPVDIVTDIPDLEHAQRRLLGATIGKYRILNVYAPNGAAPDSDKYHYKLKWLHQLANFVEQQLKIYPDLVLLGDFNIAPEEADVYDPKACEGQVLVSPLERAALRNILQLGLVDTYRLFSQPSQTFSWWDYRQGAFRRNQGLRIDLILASTLLAERCVMSSIDKTPRAWTQPSDHAPVVAEFDDSNR